MNNNYIKIKEEFLPDINSTAVLYSHKKTKARVITIKCDDPNKVFCITFKTPAINSCGLTHILEHSVLCGSKKYPLKDPFIELTKSSVNTYLNAFTQADRTSYPVASTNLKDFKNLMDVYLDAVFNPLIYEREEIFQTEGWHYEITDKDSPLTINGVVYNEMKGVFSNPDDIIEREIMHSLYPDTNYQYESGGDPKDIPSLTYQSFLDFHKKYYSPSNSYIFLYGALDMEERLNYLDNEYLSHFDYVKVDNEIKLQHSFDKPKKFIKTYNVTREEDCKNEYIYSYNISLSSALDVKQNEALRILTNSLFSSEKSKIKQRLINENIAKSFYGALDDEILQPYITLVAKGCNEDNFDKFKNIIEEELNNIVNNGVDYSEIEATLDYLEFETREDNQGSAPKGIGYFMDIMSTFTYSSDLPFENLKLLEYYKELRTLLNTNYYNDLIKNLIVNNNHKSYVILKPVLDNKEEDIKLAKKLEDYKNSLSDTELEDLINNYKKLLTYQQTPDSKEVKSMIPTLTLDDIDKNPRWYNLDILDNNILHSEYFTKDIIYKKYLFKIDSFNKEDIQYISLLANLLGSLSTQDYTYQEFEYKELKYTGGISTILKTVRLKNGKYNIYFLVNFSYQNNKAKEACEFVNSMLFNTIFSDTKRLKELLVKYQRNIRKSLISSAHTLSKFRVLSYTIESLKIADVICGIDYYYFLTDLVNNFDTKVEDILNKLQSLYKIIFHKDVIIHLTCSKDNYLSDLENINLFKSKLVDKADLNHTFEFKKEILNEAFILPIDVNYVSIGGYVDTDFDNSIVVLDEYLSDDYLWNEVRIKGGAYGVFLSTNSNSKFACVTSFRDPSIKNTYNAVINMPNYVRNLNLTEEELLHSKLAVLSQSSDHVERLGERALDFYLTKRTYEDRKNTIEKVINMTLEDYHKLSKVYEEAINNNAICVVGNKKSINQNKKLFKNIIEI